MGRHLNFIIPVDERPHVDAIWHALVTQSGGSRSTNQNVRKDGGFIACEWYNTPLIDGAGETIGVASLVQDVTEIRRNEDAIRQMNVELEARVAKRTVQLADANKELESFCHSVSHDLRAPLRSIDGFSKLLLEDFSDRHDALGLDYLKRVRAASQRMGRLIDDLLSLSRINRGELRRIQVDLGPIARRIADRLKTTQGERQIEWVMAATVPARGDKNYLTILLDNLLGNAVKYTGRKTVARIEFGMLPDEAPAVYFVKDNGAGFDMSLADKLFQPFQRLHAPSEFEGHGIGLATVQRIVQRHGGRIWADAAVDQGATFLFTLEAPPLDAIPLKAQPEEPS